MIHCPQTSQLLERSLALDARVASPSDHLTDCVACRTAVQRIATFDAALARVARSVVVAPLDRPQVWPPYSPPRPGWQRGTLLAVAGIALIILATALVVWKPLHIAGIGDRPASTPVSSPSVEPAGVMGRSHASLASLLIGVPPEDVVITEDGALGVTYEDGELALVLVRAVGEEAERLTLASIPVVIEDGVSLYAGTAVTCPDELGLVRKRYLFGYSQGPNAPGPVTLEGLDAVGGWSSTGTHLFALAPGTLNPNQTWIIATTNGKETSTGQFFEDVRVNGVLTPTGCRMHT